METLLSKHYNEVRRRLVGQHASRELRPGVVPGYGAAPIARIALMAPTKISPTPVPTARASQRFARFDELDVAPTGRRGRRRLVAQTRLGRR
jgi:gamma-glutamyltranspeptidase / glutathione hydrolase